MYIFNEFSTKANLDEQLADKIASGLVEAVATKGKASIAVSGGSTPKALFQRLSNMDLPWNKISITLADERWVDINDDASNTKLVYENLLQNKAKEAKFFHLKQGESLCEETLNDLNVAAKSSILPLDILILGMGEDGHTASLFPCSKEIEQGLSKNNTDALMAVTPTTAPFDRISFTFNALKQSKHIFLHISGVNKKQVFEQVVQCNDNRKMPINAFLSNPDINTQVYWAE